MFTYNHALDSQCHFKVSVWHHMLQALYGPYHVTIALAEQIVC